MFPTVLAIDYRSLARRPIPAVYPEPIEDVLAALVWLKDQGASSLYLYGDSSGGTQVVETLLFMANRQRDIEKATANGDTIILRASDSVKVTAAATFSAWLDFSSSFQQYDTRRSCEGPCNDIASMVFRGDAGPDRLGSMCQSRKYVNYQRATN